MGNGVKSVMVGHDKVDKSAYIIDKLVKIKLQVRMPRFTNKLIAPPISICSLHSVPLQLQNKKTEHKHEKLNIGIAARQH
jgi:hypothetical protein